MRSLITAHLVLCESLFMLRSCDLCFLQRLEESISMFSLGWYGRPFEVQNCRITLSDAFQVDTVLRPYCCAIVRHIDHCRVLRSSLQWSLWLWPPQRIWPWVARRWDSHTALSWIKCRQYIIRADVLPSSAGSDALFLYIWTGYSFYFLKVDMPYLLSKGRSEELKDESSLATIVSALSWNIGFIGIVSITSYCNLCFVSKADDLRGLNISPKTNAHSVLMRIIGYI